MGERKRLGHCKERNACGEVLSTMMNFIFTTNPAAHVTLNSHQRKGGKPNAIEIDDSCDYPDKK